MPRQPDSRTPLKYELVAEAYKTEKNTDALAKKLKMTVRQIHQHMYTARLHGLIPQSGKCTSQRSAQKRSAYKQKPATGAAPADVTARVSGTSAAVYAQQASNVVRLLEEIEQLDDAFLLHIKMYVDDMAGQRFQQLSDHLKLGNAGADSGKGYTPLKTAVNPVKMSMM